MQVEYWGEYWSQPTGICCSKSALKAMLNQEGHILTPCNSVSLQERPPWAGQEGETSVPKSLLMQEELLEKLGNQAILFEHHQPEAA